MGLNNQGQLGDQTTDNSPYPVVVGSSPVSLDSKVLRLHPVVVGSSPVSLDSKVLRLHPTDEADVTATSSATVFSLFNTSTTTTSEVTWRILNPNIAEIVSSTPSAATGGLTSTTVKVRGAATGGLTSTTVKVRGLKTGSTVLIATDSLTGKTVATHITVSEGFTNPKIAIGDGM